MAFPVRLPALVLCLVVVVGACLVSAPAQALGSATLSGTAGQAGVTVGVYPVGAADPLATATTSAEGTFTVGSLDAGTYEVRFSKQHSALVWYGGGESRATAQPVDLVEGASVELDPVSLSAAGTVRGTVRIDGTARSSIRVHVLKLLDGQWVAETPNANTAWTSSTGAFSYRLSTLLPVQLYLEAGPSGSKLYRYYYGDAYSPDTATSVEVPSGDTVSGIDIDAPASGSLAGKLTNSFGGPIGGKVTVWVRDHGQVVPLTMNIPVSSSYTNGFTAGVPAGPDLTVSGATSGFSVGFLGGATGSDQATYTTALPGGTRTGVSVPLLGGSGIRGRLVQDQWLGGNRLPASGLQLSAWWNDTLMSRATTDDSGYFRLAGLSYYDAPRVQIRVESPGVQTAWLRGFSELTTDRAGASTYAPEYDNQDDRLNDFAVTYLPEAQFHATTDLRAVNQVAGKPLTLQLPEWSTQPDQVTVYSDVGWLYEVTTVTSDLSGTVELPQGFTKSGPLWAVASKDGFQSAIAATYMELTPFAVTDPPKIQGAPAPGTTLTLVPATYNADPDEVVTTWYRSGDGAIQARGSTYRVRVADVGHTVRAVVRARYGSSEQTTIRSVLVAARTSLSATAWRTSGSKVAVRVRLATRGAQAPGGRVEITEAGKVLRRLVVTHAPLAMTVKMKPKSRTRKLRVVYSGTRKATAAATTARIPRH